MDSTYFQPTIFTFGLLIFAAVAVGMLLAPLLLGMLLRPFTPNPEKLEAYECGEPTIGPANVQFDLRFYVVALLFIIFDVEVAFFFPWATVFGKANTLQNPDFGARPSAQVEGIDQRTEVSRVLLGDPSASAIAPETANHLLGIAMLDLIVFFAIVLVGFAYVWKRGDLDWVRAVAAEKAAAGKPAKPANATAGVAVSA